MTDQPVLIECIFCGAVEPRGQKGEDIIPGWFATAFHGPGDYSMEAVEITPTGIVVARTRRVQTVANLRLPDVCQECNNGWMGTIENIAGPILTPMMRGETNVVLTQRERRIVSAWCQLKAVTLDARYPVRHLPDAVAHAMYLRIPLRRSLGVTLGRFRPDGGYHVYFGRRNGAHILNHADAEQTGLTPRDPTHHDIFRVTFTFGQFAFQVATAISRDLPVELLVKRGHLAWVCVWPPDLGWDDEPVTWPPREIIDGLRGLPFFL